MKKFTSLFVAVALSFATLLISCNLSATDTTAQTDTTTLQVQLGSSFSFRAANPTLDTDTNKYLYSLTGKPAEGEEKVFFSNVAYSELSSAVELVPGTWSFTLKSIYNGCVFGETKENISISSGANTLSFNLKLLDNECTGTGSIHLVITVEEGADEVKTLEFTVGDKTVIKEISEGKFDITVSELPTSLYAVKLLFKDASGKVLTSYSDTDWRVCGEYSTSVEGTAWFHREVKPGTASLSLTIDAPEWNGVVDPVVINVELTDEEESTQPEGFELDTSMFEGADAEYLQSLFNDENYDELLAYADELEELGNAEQAAYIRNKVAELNPVQVAPYTGYIVPGTYKSTNSTGDISTLVLTQETITWNGTEYIILDGKQWSEFSTTNKPNQFTYLVKDSEKSYLCCVQYYINNSKDYVKFYAPKETILTEVPASSDYTLVGSLSKALQDVKYASWSVEFENATTNGTVKVSRSQAVGETEKITVVAGGKTWVADFRTWVKNFDLSMPAGDKREEMQVDVAVWLSSSHTSPHLLAQPSGYALEYAYPFPTGPVFYELQCCESLGMYLLSVTSASLVWDDEVLDADGEEGDYYFSYQVVENLTLTKDQFDSLMIHFN